MAHHDNPFLIHYEIKYKRKVLQKQAKTRYFESMGHVAKCYKVFFHKDLNIFSLFL